MAPPPVLLPGKSHGQRSLVGGSLWDLEESDMTEQLHFHFYVLEKEMATHSSVLAWRIPGIGEPGGLPYMGSHRVGHNWSDLAAAAVLCNKDLMCRQANYGFDFIIPKRIHMYIEFELYFGWFLFVCKTCYRSRSTEKKYLFAYVCILWININNS